MSRPKKKPTIEAQLGDLITQAVEERQFELSKKLISLLDECLSIDYNQAAKEGTDAV